MAATSRARQRALACLAALAATAGGTAVVLSSPPAAAVETISLPASGPITVHGNGNGHGHGMSQYGAKGAALAGLSSTDIVRFYYPGATLVTLAPSTIRVWISRSGTYPTVQAAAGMTVTGVSGTLPTTGIARYRLVPSGTGLALQKLGTASGAAWQGVQSGLAAIATFASTQGFVRTYLADGSSTSYRGSIAGVRSGTGVITVNYVGLDEYTEGVTPRESPASWPAAAVHAQAIAARTYGRNAVESHGGSSYDICDTSQCQEYGGMTHYDSAGNVLWTDDPAAIQSNQNKVLRYDGATIFAQFSASDGGWTVDGGKPYLVAKADPYDNAASGDPYIDWVERPDVSSIADYYGLQRATAIRITARDGHGDWGGRVLSAIVDGIDSANTVQHIDTTGFELQDALGLMTNWFGITQPVLPPSAPQNVTATPSDAGVIVRWSAPASTGGSAITGYTITFGTHKVTTSASARSAFAGPRVNGSRATVVVRAQNAGGYGDPASVAAVPMAQPQLVTPLPAARLFDTRSPAIVVDPSHLFKFNLAGHAGVPAHPRAVQLALTVLHPSASGVIRVHTWGEDSSASASVAYQYGKMSTATITVPLFSSTTVAFQPSAGSVELLADVMGYSGAGGELTAVKPRAAALLSSVPTGAGTTVPVRSLVGSSATGVLALVNATTTSKAGWLRLWSSGSAPSVNQVSVLPGGSNSNVVLLPIGSDGAIRMASSSSSIGGKITIIGVVAPASAGSGTLESFPAVGTADSIVRGSSDVSVDVTPAAIPVLGTAQVPGAHVQLVVLLVTVSDASDAGALWVYPGDGAHTKTPTLEFGPGKPLTTTVVVQPGTNGSVGFLSTGPTASVAVDAVGYVTAP
jgi:peptidoglycan hydrolase-like amidase